jgi:FMN-dependent NADH-azoreductase
MQVLNVLASPRKETSVSSGIVEVFLSEYQQHASHVVVDTLNVWEESLPDFDAEAIGAKYKGVSGAQMSAAEAATWERIKESWQEGSKTPNGLSWAFRCGTSLFHIS